MRTKGKDVPAYVTLKSSAELGWSTLLAEFRSYRRSEGSDPVAPMAKIAIVLSGSRNGVAKYRMGRNWLSAELTPGTVWLKPSGGKHDEYEIASPKVRVLDLYLPASVFAQLGEDYNLPNKPERLVRHEAGMQDEVIHQVGLSLFSEMRNPTVAGCMLAETSSLLLAARLVHAHLDADGIRLPIQSRHPLDDRRLRRVLDYVEQHLTDDIAVTDLANVACLSIFHFTRAFSVATGMPPHRYVSQRRLDRAKEMIVTGNASIAETAFMFRFSSQSSFTRAFRRATGTTPAMYRHAHNS
jgi:AraC family transcriptional regulator